MNNGNDAYKIYLKSRSKITYFKNNHGTTRIRFYILACITNHRAPPSPYISFYYPVKYDGTPVPHKFKLHVTFPLVWSLVKNLQKHITQFDVTSDYVRLCDRRAHSAYTSCRNCPG